MGFKFKQADTGSAGGFFNANKAADAGSRLLIRPTAFVPQKKLPFGNADVVEADVVDLDTSETYYRAEFTNKVVRDALKDEVSGAELFLFRLKHGNKAMLFENLTDAETQALAEAYLAGHPGFATGADRDAAEQAPTQNAPTPATAPVAAAAPQANPLQQAAAAFGDDVKKMARSVFDSLPPDAQQQVLATGVQVEG